MEEETIESHTWARTRIGLKSIKLSWIFKLTFFYFLTLFISSVLPTSNAKIPQNSFSDSFGYLDLESNNDIADLDEYNFKSVILEYPTVFVYFNFDNNNNKRNAAVLQTLELVAQLLSNKNVLVAKVTDKQFARTLDITESGSFCAYHKGNTFPFYGYPVADVIMHFILKIKEPVVKEITGKETKIAFDKVDVPTFVGFFEEENEEYSVFEEAALSYLPYVQFYATFDETVALHLKLNEPGTYRYRRPLEEKSFLIEESLGTTEDVHSVVDKYRNGPLQKFSLHNIYHPWNKEEKEDEFLAFADPKSPKGKTFHKILMKFVKKETEKEDFDVKITWIDPSQYPMMIPIWENKYDINLSEPHFGHVTDSEVRWLDIERVEEFEGRHEKHSIIRKWIRNEEDPYTPEEPEPEEVDGQGDEEAAADDVNKEGGQTEEDAEQQTCGNEVECSNEETNGTEDTEEEEGSEESEGAEEVGDEEAQADEQQNVGETTQGEDEYVIEDEWMDYFDRLEEMEMSKDKEKEKEKKAEVKEEKVVERPKPNDKPAAKPKVAAAKKQLGKEEKKQTNKKAKVVSKEPKEEAKITSAELEETLNEINKLVDTITNGKNGHDTKAKEQTQDIKEETKEPKVDETVKTLKSEEENEEKTESEEISTDDILQTAEEIVLENEALRKENGELREELKEELEEDDEEEDDDDDDEEEDVTPQKPDVMRQNVYKDAENYPTYNVDLDVLVDSFEEGTKDEWDQYFDDLEQKKSSGPQPDQQVPKESILKKKKHVPESHVFKEENYPHYNVDLDVLVDSFEGGAQDEWTRYFDALEAEEDKRLNEKVKKKKGRRSGGGSSFFAEGMPVKDNKTRIKQFLEREKQRRGQMKQKIDRDSIKSYLMGKSSEKKKDNPKETIEYENDKSDTKVEELLEEEKTIEQDPQLQTQESVEDSSILRETLLKLVKDVEMLLYQNGHPSEDATDEATTTDKQSEEEPKTARDGKSKKLKGEVNTEKSSKLKGDNLEIFPSNIDLTDPESIVRSIKHTTNVANKMMQEFADSLTAQILDVKAARAKNGEDDDDEGDEPWEVIEERDEKLKELCKKGRLSSADCNQVIHGRSMEHVHNFHKVKSPKVPRFKPSPTPSPEELKEVQEPTQDQTKGETGLKSECGADVTDTQNEPVSQTIETPDIQAEPTFDDNIMSETGTNFDESLFYDQETIDRKEEEKFYYKFEDWESPASSSPTVKGALDYRSQKYFDELEGVETTTSTVTTPLPPDDHFKVESENAVKDNKGDNEQMKKRESKEHQSDKSAKENVGKKEEKKKEKKQDKKCDCEKERKQLKSKKDKHYDEEEWESGKFKGKKESSDTEPCDCKWKLLP